MKLVFRLFLFLVHKSLFNGRVPSTQQLINSFLLLSGFPSKVLRLSNPLGNVFKLNSFDAIIMNNCLIFFLILSVLNLILFINIFVAVEFRGGLNLSQAFC